MFLYWALFFIPLFALLTSRKITSQLRRLQFSIYGLFLVMLIGFRFEVGGDWFGYIDNYSNFLGVEFSYIPWESDFAYEIIYWFSLNSFGGVYFVNFICALIFVSGLIRFSLTMPLPWLALLISTPFLIIVVSMGYTRQAAALGFLMHGILALLKGKNLTFYFLIIMGALFHKTLLPLSIIGFLYNYSFKFNMINLINISIVLIFVAWIFSTSEAQVLLLYYFYEPIHDSKGAILRILINLFSAVIFLLFIKKYRNYYSDTRLWHLFSTVSILLVPMSVVISTLSDRVAIYFTLLQLVVLTRIPFLIESTHKRNIFIMLIIAMYFIYMFVWFNFGLHSYLWLPYRNILLE
jgi:hypothetical protein